MQHRAGDELRSLNARIEQVLRDVLRKAGPLPGLKLEEEKKDEG